MRPMLPLLVALTPVLLAAQAPRLDHGRLDPAWFGPGLVFERSGRVYFLWVRPDLSLKGRILHVQSWEGAAWLVKPRPDKDQAFLRRLEPILVPGLVEGFRAELRGTLPVSLESGDLLLTGRITDCLADGVGGLFGGLGGIYFDLKLTDSRTGDLLLAAHHFLEGATAESIQTRYQTWCRTFARVLAERTLPPLASQPLPPLRPADPMPSASRPSAPPAASELEATLRRLEGLRRDGLLTEDEFQVLRKQAVERAKTQR